MFESFIVTILNQVLGQFLEGLSSKDLSVGIWSGDVNLNNVKIRGSGLDFLNLPIEIKNGYVSKLLINANWRKLTSQPIRVNLEGVYATVGTRTKFDVDQKKAAEEAIQNKLSQLKAIEDLRLEQEQQRALAANGDKSAEGGTGLASKYVTQIIENLQINVSDIHITYEEMVEGENVQVGACLGGLQVMTTDEHWKKAYIDASTQRYSFKLVSLDQLFLYTCSGRSGLNRTGQVVLPKPADVLKDPANHYIIEPVNGFLRLKLNKNRDPSPKAKVESLVESIKFSLSQKQYVAVLRIIAHIGQAQQKTASLKAGADEFRDATPHERREYIDLYKRHLNAMWLPALSYLESNRRTELEHQLTFDNLKTFRTAAWKELKHELGKDKPIKTREQAQHEQGGLVWKAAASVTRLFGYHTKAQEQVEHHELSRDEQEELYVEAEDGDTNDLDADELVALPKDYRVADATFKLPELSLSLTDLDFEPLTILSITATTVHVLKLPTSLVIRAKVEDMIMRDLYTLDSFYPELVQCTNKLEAGDSIAKSENDEEDAGAILHLNFEQAPIDNEDIDQRIQIKLVAPTIVTHAQFIARLVAFFAMPPDLDLSLVQEWSADQLAQLQQFSSISLTDALRDHSSQDLSLDIDAPVIAIPVDPTKQIGDVLILDLGTIKLNSQLQPKHVIHELNRFMKDELSKNNQISSESMDERRRAECYDRKHVEVDQISIFFSAAGSQWQMTQDTEQDKAFILQPVDVKLDVDACVTPDVNFLPAMKISTDLGALQLTVSPMKYDRLMKLGNSFSIMGKSSEELDAEHEQLEAQKAGRHSTKPLPPSSTQSKGAFAAADSLLNDLQHQDDKQKAQFEQHGGELGIDDLTKLMQSRKDAEELMKEVDEDGSGTVSQEEFSQWFVKRRREKVDNQKILIRFTLEAIELAISADPNTGDSATSGQLLTRASIDDIAFAMLQREYDMQLGSTIGALSIEDSVTQHLNAQYILKTSSGKTKNRLVDVDESKMPPSKDDDPSDGANDIIPKMTTNEAFIQLTLTQTNPQSPQFDDHRTIIDLALDIGQLALTADRDAVPRLAGFFINDFLKLDMSDGDADLSHEDQERKAANERKQQMAQQATSFARKQREDGSVEVEHEQRKPRTDVIQARVQARFNCIQVLVVADGNDVLDAKVLGTEATFRKFPLSLAAEAQLAVISVIDKTPAGQQHYSDIVTTTAAEYSQQSDSEEEIQPLARVKFDTFSSQESDYPNHDAEAKGRFTGLRVVFLNRFVTELTLFATAGPIGKFTQSLSQQSAKPDTQQIQLSSGQHIAVASPAAQAQRKQQREEQAQPLVLPKLDIKIRGLEVIVPGSSRSTQHLRAVLSEIDVFNKQVATSKRDHTKYEHIACHITNIFVETRVRRSSQQFERKHLIDLETISVGVDVIAHKRQIFVDAEIPELDMQMTPSQYQFLALKLPKNFAEPSTVIKPDDVVEQEEHGDEDELNALTSLDNQPQRARRKSSSAERKRKQSVSANGASTGESLSTLPTIKIQFALRKIKVAMSEDELPGESNAEEDELLLIQLLIVDILADAKIKGGDIDAQAQIVKVSLTDASRAGAFLNQRKVLPQYRELLRLSQPDTEGDATNEESKPTDNSSKLIPIVKEKSSDGHGDSEDDSMVVREGTNETFGVPFAIDIEDPHTPLIATFKRRQSTDDLTGVIHADNHADLKLRNLRFSMGSVLLRIPIFFAAADPSTNDETAPVDDTNTANDPSAQATAFTAATTAAVDVAPPVVQSKSTQSFRITAAIINPSLQLIADPTSSQTTALYVTFGVSLDADVNLNVDCKGIMLVRAGAGLQDFKIFVTNLDTNSDDFNAQRTAPNSSAQILSPFGISVEANIETPEPKPSTPQLLSLPKLNINVGVSDIGLRFTYTTYRLMMQSIEALTKATGQPTEDPNALIEAALKRRRERAATEAESMLADDQSSVACSAGTPTTKSPALDRGASTDDNESILGPVLPSSTLGVLASSGAIVEPPVIGLFGYETINLLVGRISLIFVNDALETDIPIAQVAVHRIAAQLHGFGHHRTARVQMALSGDYYNLVLATWEPMIETTSLTATVSQTHILLQGNVKFSSATAAYSTRLLESGTPSPLASNGPLHGQRASPAGAKAPAVSQLGQKQQVNTQIVNQRSYLNRQQADSTPSTVSRSQSDVEPSDDNQIKYVDQAIPGTATVATWLTVATDRVLNVNVTHAMFVSVMDTMNLLAQVEQQSKGREQDLGSATASTHFFPYKFVNATELPIVLQATILAAPPPTGATSDATVAKKTAELAATNGSRRNSATDAAQPALVNTHGKPKQTLELTPFSEEYFDFPAKVDWGRRAVTVSFADTSIQPHSFLLSMSKVQTQTYRLNLTPTPVKTAGVRPPTSARGVQLLADVYIVKGIKHIRLRSSVGVINRLQQPIIIQKPGVNAHDTTAEGHERTLKHDEIFWLPLRAPHDAPMQLRLPGTTYTHSQTLTVVHPPVTASRTQYFSSNVTSQPASTAQGADQASAPTNFFGVLHARHMMSAAMADVDAMDDDSSEAESAAAKQQGTYNNEGKTVDYGTLYVIRPAACIQNLTAAPVQIALNEIVGAGSTNIRKGGSPSTSRSNSSSQLSTSFTDTASSNGEAVRYQATLKQGEEVDVAATAMSKQRPSQLHIRFPTLRTNWSTGQPIARSDNSNSSTTVYTICVTDKQHRELYVKVEASTVQGCVRLVIYTTYWLFDMTDTGLIPSIDTKHTVPLGDSSEFVNQIHNDNKRPIMLDYPEKASNKLRLCTLATAEATKSLSDIEWSTGLNIANAGFSGTVECTSMTRIANTDKYSKGSVEIGVQIANGSGPYYRTKMVTLTPHYVVVNELDVDIELRQAKTYRDVGSMVVPAGKQQAYHWPVASADHVISFRRATIQDGRKSSEMAGWHWSGMVAPNEAGDVYFTCRHKYEPNMIWYPRVSLRAQGATTYIVINQFEQRASVLREYMPYRITNKCVNTYLRFRQYTSEGVLEWITVPPYSSLPWCYEHPLLKGAIEVEMNRLSAETNKYERKVQAKLDTDEDVGSYTVTTAEGAKAAVYLYIHEDGPTKELVMSAYPNPDKIVPTKQATKAQQLALFRNQRLRELLPMQSAVAEQTRKLQQRRKRLYHAFNCQQRGQIKRPTGLPDDQPYLLVRVTAARNLPMASPYLIITYNNRSVRSRAMSADKLNFEALVPITDADNASSCTIELRDSAQSLPDRPVGYMKFMLSELASHQQQTSWQRLHAVPGLHNLQQHKTGDLELTLWWIPAAVSVLERDLHRDNLAYSEKRRILTSIKSEIDAIQQLTNPERAICGSNEFTFLISLWSVHGMRPMLSSLPDGKVVCHLHSINTGKQASVLISSHNDDSITDGPFEWVQPVPFTVTESLMVERADSIQVEFQLIPHERTLPPITIAHSAIPLAGIPTDDPRKPQKENGWLDKCLPLVSDLPDASVDATDLSVHVGVRKLPAKSDEFRASLRFAASVDVGVSLVTEQPQELMYLSVAGLSMVAEDSYTQQTLAIKCQNIQIDNQTLDTLYPIILGATPVSVDEKQPLIQLSVNKAKDRRPVLIIEYMSLLIQAIDIKVEEALIWKILSYVNEFLAQTTDHDIDAATEKASNKKASEVLLPPNWSSGMMYFEFLQLQPIALNVSFQAKPGLRSSGRSFVWNPLMLVLSVAGSTLGCIDSAPIRLNGKLIEHALNSGSMLASTLASHYIRALLTQAYKVLGSFEAIGNPVGLATNVGSGVYDFFYLPSQGIVQSPEEFGRGLAKGSISLLKNTMSGVFGSFGSVSNTLSKGVAVMSLDEEYIESQQRHRQSEPKTVASGLFGGFKRFGNSVVKGVTGVVNDPLKGAQAEGGVGFAKGVGKGALGLIAKPLSGAFDLVTSTSRGIGNTATTLLDNKVVPLPIRPQRYIDSHGLRPYDRKAAEQHVAEQKKMSYQQRKLNQQNMTSM